MLRRTFAVGLFAAVALFAVSVRAAEKAEKEKKPVLFIEPNPFKKLPSKPGPTVEKIRKLKDKGWLNLGKPKPDPVWGVARGRSWGGHAMVACPEYRGAVFTGEGRHAYVKPENGYGMDDWWFYDINQNAWVCLFPGAACQHLPQLVKDGTISVDSLGRVTGPKGQPLPGHLTIHTYHGLTWDPTQKKFYLFPTFTPHQSYYFPGTSGNRPAKKAISTALSQLKGQGLNKLGRSIGPWAYSLRTGKFEYEKTENGFFARPHLTRTFCSYIPSRKKMFAASGDGKVGYFNPKTNSWEDVRRTSLRIYESSGCLDTKRDRIYISKPYNKKAPVAAYQCYDLNTGKTTDIPLPKKHKALRLGVNHTSVTYDQASDRVLIWCHSARTILRLNPETNEFIMPPLAYDPAYGRKGPSQAFYDTKLKAHFLFTAGDSRNDGVMWVFKYSDTTVASSRKDPASKQGKDKLDR